MEKLTTLKGQKALVTGAATGIGRACVMALAASGADVAVNYLDQLEEANQVANQAVEKHGVQSLAIQADVSQESDVTRMFSEVASAFGRLDIVVSNAGIQADASFVDMKLDQWQKVLDVNLTGAFLCSRAAVRQFLKQDAVAEQSRSIGKIVFISSVHQLIPWSGHANYAASKGGVMLLMKSIAQEFAARKIRVNALAPGAIKTDINRDAWEDESAAEELRELIPYGRIGETDDIGPIVAWLCSDAADYITGTTLFVDGGMLLYPGFRTGG